MKTARTLEKGLLILSLFDREHPRWMLSGISEVTGIPMPTALRLARTLEKARYLNYNRKTRSYELGPAIRKAVFVARSHSELIRITRPHLERLTETTTESTALGVWENQGSLVIDMILTPRPFKPASLVGSALPGLSSVYAKIAVAFSNEEVLEAALDMDCPKLTENTITDPEQLREEIRNIRRERVAYGIESIVVGICTVASPIFDSDGKVVASMAVVAPTERFGPIEMRKYGAAVLQEATLVSREFGWTEDWRTGIPELSTVTGR